MTDEREGWFERLTETLLSGPENTPEERAQFRAEREAEKTTCLALR
ncbi:MAG: hypothetical protein K2Z81_02445 [Cyanobacteria bacterium]|nr:hypothetical protein [Cyanobacteriota bacterium]